MGKKIKKDDEEILELEIYRAMQQLAEMTLEFSTIPLPKVANPASQSAENWFCVRVVPKLLTPYPGTRPEINLPKSGYYDVRVVQEKEDKEKFDPILSVIYKLSSFLLTYFDVSKSGNTLIIRRR